MNSGLIITEERAGSQKQVLVLRLSGYLDGHTFVDLERKLDAIFKPGSARVVIELSGLTYIASAGLGVFINGQHQAANSGGSLQLVNPTPSVREIFSILGLESLFVIHDTLDQGVEAAQG